MKEVLTYRLGPIPWALSNPNGTLRKTNEAQLSKHLKRDITPSDTIPSNSACIIDGMAMVQKILVNTKKEFNLWGSSKGHIVCCSKGGNIHPSH